MPDAATPASSVDLLERFGREIMRGCYIDREENMDLMGLFYHSLACPRRNNCTLARILTRDRVDGAATTVSMWFWGHAINSSG